MRIYWNNFLDSESSVTAYSELASYPATNVLDTRVSRVYHSTIVNSTEILRFSETINATFGAIIGHNISSSATIYFEGSSSFSTWATVATFSTTVPWSSGILLLPFVSSSFAYWQVRIVNNSTALSYTQIGCVNIGTWLQLPGMKPDQTINRNTSAKITIGESGQAYGDDGFNYSEFKINFPYITIDKRDEIQTMFDNVKNYKPVVVQIWETFSSYEKPLYCILDQTNLEWKRTNDFYKPWSVSLNFREVF